MALNNRNGKKEETPRQTYACAHSECPYPAVLQRKVGRSGWVWLCKAHNLQHNQQEADEFCRTNGLTDRAAQMAFIREKLASKPTPTEHWEKVQQTHGLLPIAYEMAEKFLGRRRVREPGEEG